VAPRALARSIWGCRPPSQLCDAQGSGRIDEVECRGVARMMGVDEDSLSRLLKKYGSSDTTVDCAEFQKGLENLFTLNKLKSAGPTDMSSSVRHAITELRKDPWRGMCTINWIGGAPKLVYDVLKPVVEAWECFDVGKSTFQLVSTEVKDTTPSGWEIVVKGLNELCPSNPRRTAQSKKWSELEGGLMFEHIQSISLVRCAYSDEGTATA